MPVVNGKYYSQEELDAIKRQSSSSEFEKFLVSGVVGALTGSSIIGGLVGGSLLGGLVGDLLEGDDDSIF
jgi:hypothetical protein